MSEKRFICGLGFPINSDDPIRIISDSVEDKDYYKFSDICNVLNEQQATINKQKKRIIELEQRDYDNQSERYKILGRAIELSANYIEDNDLEYFDFCGLVTEFENELLEGLNE